MKPSVSPASDFPQKLGALCEELSLPSTCIAPLQRYVALIQSYGRRFNLVGNTDPSFIENSMVLGSLELLRVKIPAGHLVDVGSGAGVPGIPLALVVPELAVTLVEVRQKKIAFLRRVLGELGLRRVRVEERPIEQWPSPPCDWAVARAFKPLDEWLRLAVALVREGGSIGAYTTERDWARVTLPSTLTPVGAIDDRTQPGRIVAVLTKADAHRASPGPEPLRGGGKAPRIHH